jgi:selenocysteine lyase/cysteine desulfurase
MNDIDGIGRLAHKYGARILVDAAQLAAHRHIDMDSVGIDYLVFSGHKMYAPFGCGGLIVRKGLFASDESLTDDIARSGNDNVVGIAALGKAMMILNNIGLDVVAEWEEALKGGSSKVSITYPKCEYLDTMGVYRTKGSGQDLWCRFA